MIKKRINSSDEDDDEDDDDLISDKSPESKNDSRYSKLHTSFLEGNF